MKREMMQNIMTKRDINQYKLKSQPVKRLMRNIKGIKFSLLKKVCMKFVKVEKQTITYLVMMLIILKKQK